MNGAATSWTPSGSGPGSAIGAEMTGSPMKDNGWVNTPRCARIGTSTPATVVVGGAPIRGRREGRGRRQDDVHVAEDFAHALLEPGAESLRVEIVRRGDQGAGAEPVAG